MTDLVIDLDNPHALDARTVLQKTILCWEDFGAKNVSLAGHEIVIRPKSFAEQRDTCGNGLGVYMLTKPQMAWKSSTVYYHVDPTNCNERNKTAVLAAINAAFASYNQITGAKTMFKPTTDRAQAKIKVYWASHDGPLGQLAVCNYYYYPTRGEIISATIKFDQNDSWFIASAPQCGYTNDPFDIQHTAAHEIGHATGLAHVFNDPDSTLFPTVKRGETKGRSLDTGTVKAIKYLYGVT